MVKGKWAALSATHRGGYGFATGDSLPLTISSARSTCKKYTGSEGDIKVCIFGSNFGVPFSVSIDRKFPSAERRILRQAVVQAVFRMAAFNRGLNAARWKIPTKAQRQMFGKDYEKTNERLDNIMSAQIIYIGMGYLPHLRVNAFHKKAGPLGWAYVGSGVLPYGTRSSGDAGGGCEINLNRYYVNAHSRYKKASFWAGTIAHEIMHVLGHSHPTTTDHATNYATQWQINLLTDRVRNNCFNSGNKVTAYSTCGCRWR